MSERTSRTASVAGKQSTPLEAIHDRIGRHNSRLSDALSALGIAVDRIVGPILAEAIDEPADPPASSSMSKIGNMLGTQDSIVRRLAEQVQRVTELG